MEFKRRLPRSSTPNCHWPPGWDIAGERARPGCRFRRRAVRAVPSAVRRGIFVEPQTKIIFSPVGAASSVRTPDDVAPDGALSVCVWRCYKYVSPDGLEKIRVYRCPSVVENSNAHCPVRPLQTAIGRCLRTATN